MERFGAAGTEVDFVGSPDTVAERMGEVMEAVGGDGFLISTPFQRTSRRFITEVTEGLVPALQRRGLARTAYTGPRCGGAARVLSDARQWHMTCWAAYGASNKGNSPCTTTPRAGFTRRVALATVGATALSAAFSPVRAASGGTIRVAYPAAVATLDPAKFRVGGLDRTTRSACSTG